MVSNINNSEVFVPQLNLTLTELKVWLVKEMGMKEGKVIYQGKEIEFRYLDDENHNMVFTVPNGL